MLQLECSGGKSRGQMREHTVNIVMRINLCSKQPKTQDNTGKLPSQDTRKHVYSKEGNGSDLFKEWSSPQNLMAGVRRSTIFEGFMLHGHLFDYI